MSIINANSGGIYFTADSSGNVAISSNGVVGVTVPNNGGIIIASWETSTRPTSPSTGQVGFNTTLDTLEQYDGSSWIVLGRNLSIPQYNFIVNTGSPNITSSSCNNFFVGNCAGSSITNGSHNNFLGSCAGRATTTGSSNNFFGIGSGQSNTIGGCNVFMGYFAGSNNTTGGCNIFIGCNTGGSNNIGIRNVFLGDSTGGNNTTGNDNVYIGSFSGQSKVTGTDNVFIGSSSGCFNNGSCNTFFGYRAGYTINGNNNVMIGNTSGGNFLFRNFANENIAIGSYSGQFLNGGCHNILIGCSAGYVTSGCNNILIGCCTGTDSGLACITTQSNRIILGNSSHTCAQIQVAWSVVSDCRDKLIHCRLDKGRDFLSGINPVVFSFKDRETNQVTDTKKRYGFIAQEVLQLEGDDPVIVGYDSLDKLNMTQEYLIPILVNAVNELSNEVETLRPLLQEVNILKQKLLYIENKLQ